MNDQKTRNLNGNIQVGKKELLRHHMMPILPEPQIVLDKVQIHQTILGINRIRLKVKATILDIHSTKGIRLKDTTPNNNLTTASKVMDSRTMVNNSIMTSNNLALDVEDSEVVGLECHLL